MFGFVLGQEACVMEANPVPEEALDSVGRSPAPTPGIQRS